jgi:hypothetical protein
LNHWIIISDLELGEVVRIQYGPIVKKKKIQLGQIKKKLYTQWSLQNPKKTSIVKQNGRREQA